MGQTELIIQLTHSGRPAHIKQDQINSESIIVRPIRNGESHLVCTTCGCGRADIRVKWVEEMFCGIPKPGRYV